LRKNREFEDDKIVLVENFDRANFDAEFRTFLIGYLKDSRRFEESELEVLG
jgi:hypothetical protein